MQEPITAMRRPCLPLLACLVLLAAPAHAQTSDLDYALDQLPGNGPASFAKILLPRHPEEAKRLAAALDKATDHAGPLLDHQVIVRTPISNRLTRLVIALHYEQQPVFLRVDRYESANDEFFLNAIVLRDIDALLPNDELLHQP